MGIAYVVITYSFFIEFVQP